MAFILAILSILFYGALFVIVLALILAMFAWTANSIEDAISCRVSTLKDGINIKIRHGYKWAHYWAEKLSDGTYQLVLTEHATEIKSLLPCSYAKKIATQAIFRDYIMKYHKEVQIIEILTNYKRQGG